MSGIKFLHAMVRVHDLKAALDFFSLLGLRETRRKDYPQAKFTLVYLAAPADIDALGAAAPEVELTYNYPNEEGEVLSNVPHSHFH